MATTLRIAEGLQLPLDLATQSVGVVAQRGAGKTYLAAVIIEELVGAGVPVVALDPVGVLWGLRLGAEGKERGGLPIVILGGERGDVPLEATAGKFVAEWVVTERRSCVLDLSGFRKNEQRQFVTDFAEELYRKNRQPLHVVLDEADMFMPQRPMHGEERMLGAFEDLVRRGRARGIGLTMATQRPAVIHKDCLTQVSTLVALRMVGPQDVKAIDAWIQSHGTADDRKRVLDSLPSLPVGEAWFWSPGWLGLLKRVKVRKRKTFDSSKAPTVGDKRVLPQKLAPVDLDALRGRLLQAVERAKADNPAVLRARIAELERAAKKPAPATSADVKLRDENVRLRSELAKLRDSALRVHKALGSWNGLRAFAEDLQHKFEAARNTLDIGLGVHGETAPSAPAVTAPAPRREVPPRAPRAPDEPSQREARGGLGRCERKVLAALAAYPDGRTLSQIAILSGYASTGGGFRNAVGALRVAGFLEGNNGVLLRITEAGTEALGAFEPLPTGDALLQHWLGQLGRAEREVLRVLADEYPAGLIADQIAARTDPPYESSGGGFRNALGRLRTLELIRGPSSGSMQASAELFE
jgi:hypothetical protein